jgi:hypothetical protein
MHESSITPLQFYSRAFAIHHSPLIPPSDTAYPEYLQGLVITDKEEYFVQKTASNAVTCFF